MLHSLTMEILALPNWQTLLMCRHHWHRYGLLSPFSTLWMAACATSTQAAAEFQLKLNGIACSLMKSSSKRQEHAIMAAASCNSAARRSKDGLSLKFHLTGFGVELSLSSLYFLQV